MMNLGCIRMLILLSCLAMITACASHSCYPIEIWTKGEGYPGWIGVEYAGERYTGGAYRSLDYRSCKPIPETAAVSWVDDRGREYRKVVPVREKLPEGFLENPKRVMYFRVGKDHQPEVSFQMQLSEVTERVLTQKETKQELEQRIKDEALVTAIRAKDDDAFYKALAAGANIRQPWLSTVKAHNDVLLFIAIKEDNLTAMEELYRRGLRFTDNETFGVLVVSLTNRSLSTSKWLLDHGANPNFRYSYADDQPNSRGRHTYLGEQPLLHKAIRLGDPRFVRLLLQYGAKTNVLLGDGPPYYKQPLMEWAKKEASPEVLKVLSP